jgi:hypothetical protein
MGRFPFSNLKGTHVLVYKKFSIRKSNYRIHVSPPLPGSPDYQPGTSLIHIIDYTRAELESAARGGMDSVCIGNQQIGHTRSVSVRDTRADERNSDRCSRWSLPIRFGISIFWDDLLLLPLQKPAGLPLSEGFSAVLCRRNGIDEFECRSSLRYRKLIDADDVKLMFMLRPFMAKSSTSAPAG